MLVCEGETHAARLAALLDELGRRRLTNVLVEGGSRMLGTLLDAARSTRSTPSSPRGWWAAPPPAHGRRRGRANGDAILLESPQFQQIGDDVYIRGRIEKAALSPERPGG